MKKILPLISLLFALANANAQTGYTLDECMQMASENNNRIKSGKLDTEIAQQRRKEVFTKYFATVSGSGSYFNANDELIKTSVDIQGLFTPQAAELLPAALLSALPSSIPVSLLKNGTVAAATATQPIFAGGQIINANRLAKVGEDVAELQLELTEQEVQLTTAIYFWQVVNLKEKLATIARIEQLLATLHQQTATAVEAGITENNNLLRVELKMQQTQSDRAKVENGIKICNMQLAQFTGADIESFDIVVPDFDTIDSPNLVRCDAAETVMKRTETKLLDNNVTAARLNTLISIGQQLPSIGLGAGYLYYDLVGNSTNRGVLFASVSIPISKWWSGNYATRRYRAAERKAEIDRQDKIELMTVETNQIWNEVTEAFKQIRIAEGSIHSSTENLRIATNSFKAGTEPLSELLDAQLLFQQSRNMYSDAYSTYQIKLLKYRQITSE